jgi:hypothetical protein
MRKTSLRSQARNKHETPRVRLLRPAVGCIATVNEHLPNEPMLNYVRNMSAIEKIREKILDRNQRMFAYQVDAQDFDEWFTNYVRPLRLIAETGAITINETDIGDLQGRIVRIDIDAVDFNRL